MLYLRSLRLLPSKAAIGDLPPGKLLINTVNAWSFVNAQEDALFAEALSKGDVLIPDGVSIVKACRWLGLKDRPDERVAGWDLFEAEMAALEKRGGKCMFLGSSPKVLQAIVEKAATVYPHIQVDTYSPPYKPVFSEEDNKAMTEAVRASNPDLLWIGMTAPKQEKWAYAHWKELPIHCHCGTIGAVFDFFAGTARRAPRGWQRLGLEWLYRLIREPKRMWRRYLVGNVRFLHYILKEKRAS